MSKLSILIYTDDVSMANPVGPLSLSMLKELMERNKPAFVDDFSITVLNRFKDPQQPCRLNHSLIDGFDEIWVFGRHQARVDAVFDPIVGGPDNELDGGEVQDLGEWMEEKRGGVLITGDHSQVNLSDLDPNKIFCRGRALGYHFPRARGLRAWEGKPTNDVGGRFNTQVPKGSLKPDSSSSLQGDEFPQKLELVPFSLDGSPHPIFMGTRINIEILPDHIHEGATRAPSAEELSQVKELIKDEWPKVNGKPHEPQVAAYGFDKRFVSLKAGVVVVYDGDPVSRGRIVADSSWHHYLNVNLREFGHDGDDSNLGLMGQFYRNLAVWLAPLDVRREMGHEMFKRYAFNPDVEEEIGNDPEVVGAAALEQLAEVATRGEVSELIRAVAPPEERAQPLFPAASMGLTAMPSQELVVGSILDRFQRQALLSKPPASPNAALAPARTDRELAAQGLVEAYRINRERLTEAARQAQDNHGYYEHALLRYLK